MNAHIRQRLQGIYRVLCSAFDAGASMSSASKGYEREVFISLFLGNVLPPLYRFGTGDITDALSNKDASRKSGQIDIVVEMPWAPSFLMSAGSSVRLYPAEAVGTAIEVKSNLRTQWSEVRETAQKLAILRQQLTGISVEKELTLHGTTEEPIPLYAVGYEGWKKPQTVKKHLQDVPLDGVLILKHQIFAWSDRKDHLLRVSQCEAELKKQFKGDQPDETLASCARVLELQQEVIDPAEVAAKMNNEKRSTLPKHFGGDCLPAVEPGEWGAQDIEQVAQVLSMKTEVAEEVTALFQFITVILREVAKRAGMMPDLSRYAV